MIVKTDILIAHLSRLLSSCHFIPLSPPFNVVSLKVTLWQKKLLLDLQYEVHLS